MYTIWGKDLILPTLMSYEHTFDFFRGLHAADLQVERAISSIISFVHLDGDLHYSKLN